MTPAGLATLLFAAAMGAAAGFAHLWSMRRNAGLFEQGRFAAAIALQLLRFMLLALVLFGLAKLGATALLAGALVLFLERIWLLRRRMVNA